MPAIVIPPIVIAIAKIVAILVALGLVVDVIKWIVYEWQDQCQLRKYFIVSNTCGGGCTTAGQTCVAVAPTKSYLIVFKQDTACSCRMPASGPAPAAAPGWIQQIKRGLDGWFDVFSGKKAIGKAQEVKKAMDQHAEDTDKIVRETQSLDDPPPPDNQ